MNLGFLLGCVSQQVPGSCAWKSRPASPGVKDVEGVKVLELSLDCRSKEMVTRLCPEGVCPDGKA